MPSIIVFDVIETLLDLSALDPLFEQAFGDGRVRKDWFAQLLQNALVSTLLGQYHAFDKLAKAALEMTAAKNGVTLSAEQRTPILDALKAVPAHTDVAPNLERLNAAGLRLAALTNSTARSAKAQLKHAGLSDYFEAILSVDQVERFKPAPEPYRMAAKELGGKASDLRLVTAHAWDIAGAVQAGWATALVKRPGQAVNPLGPKPDISGGDLGEVSEQILQKDKPKARDRLRL